MSWGIISTGNADGVPPQEMGMSKQMKRKGPRTNPSGHQSGTDWQRGKAGLRRSQRGNKGTQEQRLSADKDYAELCTVLQSLGWAPRRGCIVAACEDNSPVSPGVKVQLVFVKHVRGYNLLSCSFPPLSPWQLCQGDAVFPSWGNWGLEGLNDVARVT